MVNHNRIFTNSKWTSALSIHLWCFIYVYIEKSCWFGVCWVTIDTYSLPSALKTELPAQSIFITMRGWRGKEIPELKHPSGCLYIQSFTPSSYTQFNWALCSNQSYICCVSTFSAVQCFNLTPAWAVNQSICLTLAHSKHVFYEVDLNVKFFKINHLPWFCILDFCLGRHRTFWLAQERLYDATAHLFVHSAGVIIFLIKPANACYYFWGVLGLLLVSIQLQVSTRMWDGIWEILL